MSTQIEVFNKDQIKNINTRKNPITEVDTNRNVLHSLNMRIRQLKVSATLKINKNPFT